MSNRRQLLNYLFQDQKHLYQTRRLYRISTWITSIGCLIILILLFVLTWPFFQGLVWAIRMIFSANPFFWTFVISGIPLILAICVMTLILWRSPVYQPQDSPTIFNDPAGEPMDHGCEPVIAVDNETETVVDNSARHIENPEQNAELVTTNAANPNIISNAPSTNIKNDSPLPSLERDTITDQPTIDNCLPQIFARNISLSEAVQFAQDRVYMRQFQANRQNGYDPDTAVLILRELASAYDQFQAELSGSWGLRYLKPLVNLNERQISRYLETFYHAGWHHIDNIPLPYRPRKPRR